MFYRENGQYKTTYGSDQQMLPILQDRIFMGALVLFAFVVVRFTSSLRRAPRSPDPAPS